MSIRKTKKTFLLILGVFLVSTLVIQCTKQGTNASQVSRALVSNVDSTVFSPFYDSTVIATADVVPTVNDVIGTTGILSIIKSNCASATCHGGTVSPNLTTYAGIKSMVVPGNPAGSKLFQLVTTSNLNQAMPPVNYGVDLSITEKTKIYNWIANGANEYPTLVDFRPAAIATINHGCTSANCHAENTICGEWARKGLVACSATDTVLYTYISPLNSAITLYSQMQDPLLTTVWTAYKDSVKMFYSDTLANASFRPYKTFGTPVIAASRRGAFNTYDDVVMDIMYPKAVRSNKTVVYKNPVTGAPSYVSGDNLNSSSSLIMRIDSTLLTANPRTKVYASSVDGGMAYSDGGLQPSEVALIKAWYFADPNIPDVWKFGTDGSGIFKYHLSGTVIIKK